MHLSEEAVSISKITLEQLVDRYQDLVFTLCYRMVGNYCEAQDLTQETFLAAWRALDRFDGQYEKAWLCRIAANKCTDFLRRRQLQLVPDGEEAMLTRPFIPSVRTWTWTPRSAAARRAAATSLPLSQSRISKLVKISRFCASSIMRIRISSAATLSSIRAARSTLPVP